MDMTKYYWKAKDENEARVIVALLALTGKKDWSEGRGGVSGTSYPTYIAIFTACITVQRSTSAPDRTLSTTAELIEMALRGFKEPWEVAEDAYKIATVEEREKYGYPTDCKVRWYCQDSIIDDGWKPSLEGSGWNPNYASGETKAFAVPADYEFKKPVVEINTEDIMRVCGDALRAEYGDNFKIAK